MERDPVRSPRQAMEARAAADLAAWSNRAAHLRDQARHAACALRAAGLGERISLFGSLAWGEPDDRSDVDLLIWGLPASRWNDASRIVEDLVEAPVDLVRAEDAAPGLLLRVERFGVALA